VKKLDASRYQAIIKKDGEVIYELPRSQDDPFSLAVADIVASDRHYHRQTTEIYVVLEGTAEIVIGDNPPTVIQPGSATTILPGTAHYVRATAELPVRLLAVSIPAWTETDHYPA
jgi:mannose-6-phosphate isomerase-like protein (cupin superfamily)